MAKKKSNGQSVDRTQIMVAIIGVIGTIAVAAITVLANRPSNGTPTPTVDISPTNTPLVLQSGGLCLEDYLSDVTANNRLDLDTGIATRISSQKDGVYGLRLFDNGNLLGELQFTGESNTKSFKIISVINADCSQVFDYGNLDRPIAKSAIADWENLGLSFPSGKYRLRMGWYTGNQIELIFSSNQ